MLKYLKNLSSLEFLQIEINEDKTGYMLNHKKGEKRLKNE